MSRPGWGWGVVVAFAALLVLPARGSCGGGALDGNAYRSLPGSARMIYVTGIVDGATYAVAISGDGKEPDKELKFQIAGLWPCLDKMTRDQMTAIVDKHLRENPAKWHLPVSFSIWTALDSACDGPMSNLFGLKRK